MLSAVPFRAHIEAVDVAVGPGAAEYMHTLRGGGAAPGADGPPVVYIPGYGAGSGFMFRTLSALTAGLRLLAVDLLGTGLSGRPPCRARSTAEAEDFFVDSLAAWRAAQGGAADKMLLVGHSLGGYLSAVYALRHPRRVLVPRLLVQRAQRDACRRVGWRRRSALTPPRFSSCLPHPSHVAHLVLVCPAGVGRRPADWQPPEALRSPWSVRGQLFRAAQRVWDWGVTPGSIVRFMGPYGKSMVDGYTRRRFKQGQALSEAEERAFGDYMYHVLAARGSGEFALRHLLEPFAFPRDALEGRRQELRVPVTFIYGWVGARAGAACGGVLGRAGWGGGELRSCCGRRGRCGPLQWLPNTRRLRAARPRRPPPHLCVVFLVLT